MELTAGAAEVFFGTVMPHLGERQRRVLTGAMAEALGRGGQTFVADASGISTSTMARAVREVRAGVEPSQRQRAVGGGDRPAVVKQPGLAEALDGLVSPGTRGSPASPLRWTLKSTRQLSRELAAQGFRASAELVRRLLGQMGYSLQGTAKRNEGASHPDRDAQFEYLNSLASESVAAGEPVISVDTKKKELIGRYANGGTEWQPAGQPERVAVHDFPDRALGPCAKAIPYGVYDIANNDGWVSVGDSADTAEFAVNSIRRWWDTLGRDRFPDATRLLVTADAGGSNGYRPRAWKWHLARLADETGLQITVAHYPPGTSKWNKIEHRLFSFITLNWRGRPLTDIATIVELIASTTTQAGPAVQAAHDPAVYPTGTKITDQQMKQIPIQPHTWHGDWNYTITPPHHAT